MHRLVAMAFLPNPDGLPIINHKDEVPSNNAVTNLEWCTRQYNTEYSRAKHYQLINPQGEVVEVFNLNAFCRENNLPHGNMSTLVLGKGKTCKGWRLA